MKKSILLFCTVLFFASCSTEDEVNDNFQTQAKYRIEISHEGNRDAFSEFLTVVLAGASEDITATGLDGFQIIEADKIYSFILPVTSKPMDRKIETSENIMSATVTITMRAKDAVPEDELITTISIYKNDVLLKRDSHVFKGKGIDYFGLSTE